MARPPSAFSLLELLVAILFTGLLLGGMARVLRVNLGSWNRVGESLAAQRALRWSLDQVAEDLRRMGYLFPPPELRDLDVAASADPAQQSGFMLIPDQPIRKVKAGAFVPREPGEDPWEPPGKTVDELSFVMDVPLPGRAELAAAIPGLAPQGLALEPGLETDDPTLAATVAVRAPRPLDLRAGDLLLVTDRWFEFAAVRHPVRLAAGRTGTVAVARPDGAVGAAPFIRHHARGAAVQMVRPLRVVRYAVVYLALDDPLAGDNPGGLVPCLVRFEAAYPADRSVPRWAELLARSAGQPGNIAVVAENVTGFQVDLSLDGRFPGVRGADYPGTVARLQAALGGGARPLDPFWFRRHGGLLQLRIETRSPVARDEHDRKGGPARRFRYRSQTLRVVPRNFALDGDA